MLCWGLLQPPGEVARRLRAEARVRRPPLVPPSLPLLPLLLLPPWVRHAAVRPHARRVREADGAGEGRTEPARRRSVWQLAKVITLQGGLWGRGKHMPLSGTGPV